MALPAPQAAAAPLIGGQYSVDTARPLSGTGGGMPAFAVIDRRGGRTDLMAVQVDRRFPPRARALQAFADPIEGVLSPLAHGPAPDAAGNGSYYFIAPAPPGPALDSRTHAWSESELLDHVLRPAARALERLASRGLTHRAIRPNNVFQAAPGQPVVLGMAWAEPPALHQPAIAEPPYVVMCPAAARGEGSIGDDVYALGVLLLTLALGRTALAGLDDETVVRRKLDQGCFAALVGSGRLTAGIADLARGMLADDPDHRPDPALLTEPSAARARRVAARPSRRAPRPLQVAGRQAWNARALAHALASAPDAGLQALRNGMVDDWLRRHLGDAGLAMRIEEIRRPRPGEAARDRAAGDALLGMTAMALIDPLAPLCWRGVMVWPDGIGPALAAAGDSPAVEQLTEIVSTEAIGVWAALHRDRCDAPALQSEARQYRAWLGSRGPGGGVERLLYALNPLLPCASPLLGRSWVARLPDLLPALERAAATADPATTHPIDRHIAAFVAARSERRMDAEIAALGRTGEGAAEAELRLLATLQMRFDPAPLPALAKWIASRSDELLAGWHSRTRREKATARLKELAEAGQLVPIVKLLQDATERIADQREANAAAAELARLDAELAALADNAPERAALARRWGQELAAGIGLLGAVAALMAAALG
jgi:eukaryotic-like serine/threonine-protein kinase